MKVLLFCKTVTTRTGTSRRLRDWANRPGALLTAMIVFYAVAAFAAVFFATRGEQDSIGYLASLFVLGSFASRTMLSLRVLALLSNAAFMAYAYASHLPTVLLLHALLLPVNVTRLWQHLNAREQPRSDGRHEPVTRRRLGDQSLATTKL
jgi:hypothetical protein